ncbi:MAG TPA: hypothetical protein VN193_14810 [Candidatus Angelobacter sp.]|jgi:hypothetical protein|nr:hypothetical protein [Candidatus Angelobacter sp.]
MANVAEHWTDQPDEQDYPAAESYLSLLTPPATAGALAKRLRKAELEHRKAKDLLRASRLPILDPDNVHVAKDLEKVKKGTPLSPVLLVRGNLATDTALTVADGYHRICASHHLNEDADIPCRIVDTPSS